MFKYQAIYEKLLHKISTGEIAPGDKLPTEQELTREYGVSGITSKRALDMLAEKGYVERTPGKGTYLKAAGAEQTAPRGRSRILGLIADEPDGSYGLDLYFELDRIATQAGYHLVTRLSFGDQARESEEIKFLRSLDAEGIFFLPARARYYNPDILRLVLEGFPVLILDCPLHGIQAASVCSDNYNGGRMMTQYLIDLGHRNIGLVTLDRQIAISLEDRIRGYRKTLETNDLPYKREYIMDTFNWPDVSRHAEPKTEEHLESMRAFLRAHPELTACVVLQYSLAHIVSRAACDLDREISIITFDEMYDSLGDFHFTHVKQDERVIASTAWKNMMRLMSGESVELVDSIMPRLCPGDTTRPLSP